MKNLVYAILLIAAAIIDTTLASWLVRGPAEEWWDFASLAWGMVLALALVALAVWQVRCFVDSRDRKGEQR